jgi:hypothetical protein
MIAVDASADQHGFHWAIGKAFRQVVAVESVNLHLFKIRFVRSPGCHNS